MSRGLGKLQKDVLSVLEEQGKWMWARNLVTLVAMPAPGAVIPYSFYVSVLRAANSLVKGKELCSGVPPTQYGIEKWRTAYWLPTHLAPELRRIYPASLIKQNVLEAIRASSEPLSFTDVAQNLAAQIKADRYEFNRLKMPVHRAIIKLRDAHEIQAADVDGKRCWVTGSSNPTTISAFTTCP
jgi:hypothetical protein